MLRVAGHHPVPSLGPSGPAAPLPSDLGSGSRPVSSLLGVVRATASSPYPMVSLVCPRGPPPCPPHQLPGLPLTLALKWAMLVVPTRPGAQRPWLGHWLLAVQFLGAWGSWEFLGSRLGLGRNTHPHRVQNWHSAWELPTEL